MQRVDLNHIRQKGPVLMRNCSWLEADLSFRPTDSK